MNWSELDTWIVITGVLICLACALPGAFLMLNRQSMLGDGISHAVLPGLAIAFLLTDSRDLLPMVAGAVIAGVLTAILTQVAQRFGQVESGAALGVVFCGLFATGLILIRVASDKVDLDADCVLYGSIETAVVDVGRVPRVALISGGLLLVNALLTVLFYKELRLAAFDPALATTLGFNADALRLGLTLVASVTTVLAFESVGSILVIAMLVVPAAAASLLTHRLHWLLILALGLAGLSAVLGHIAAITLPGWIGAKVGQPGLGATSSAAMMAVVAGVLFLLAWSVSWLREWLRRQRPGHAPASPRDTPSSTRTPATQTQCVSPEAR
jgi:manganese/zinc/iron transport system permease protein